ncbi:MAG: hypothetical protein GY740_22185 [Gammaproteobacteria bacterium]|nr:hypothetical protein [Gammaproteobacteria bacterium]
MFGVSRTSIYALGKRIESRVLSSPEWQSSPLKQPQVESESENGENRIEMTPGRVKRTILAATFPGNASIRPTQDILEAAFEQRPSIGAISELRLEAGRRAGRVLADLDFSTVGGERDAPSVVIGRDETFFQGAPLLLVVEPVSSAILLALACKDRQAETWGAALELVKEQGLSIAGMVEDMANTYEKSQKLAGLTDATVQKDTWHLLRDGSKVKRDLERSAYKGMGIVFDLELKLSKTWDDTHFEQYIEAVAKEEQAIDQFDAYAELFPHLCDALDMVDWRAGEIRDPETANWLLTETLALMDDLTDKRVRSFIKTVHNHQHQLLTCLDRIAADLPDWQTRLSLLLPDSDDADAFQRIVARHWRLQQMLINGHKQWRSIADESALELELWTETHPGLQAFASELMHIIDAAAHTNSINECVNGILKSFLNCRQSFRNLDTIQAYLDLFVLWHNTRIFQRGKRQGKSPFQIAGIHTDSDDWLTLLGF